MAEKSLKQLQDEYINELKEAFPSFWNKATEDLEFVKNARDIDDYIGEFLATDIWLTSEAQKIEGELRKELDRKPGSWNKMLSDFIMWVKENFEAPKSPIQEIEEWVNAPGPIVQYQQYLLTEQYDKARELYKTMSSELKQLADEVAKKIFAGLLHNLSHILVKNGHLTEARQVSFLYRK